MDTDTGGAEKMLEESLMTPDGLFDLMHKNSGGKFTVQDFAHQFEMRIQIHCDELMCVDTTDDRVFAYVGRTSQCANCATIRLILPKMLTCSGCRAMHYCSKACQKEHWKGVHKQICSRENVAKQAMRVTDFCSRMLTVLSMRGDKMCMEECSAGIRHLKTAFPEHKCKKFIYTPVFDDNTLVYIPMPVNFAMHLYAGHARCEDVREILVVNGLRKRVVLVVQTKVPAVLGLRKIECVMMVTHVDRL